MIHFQSICNQNYGQHTAEDWTQGLGPGSVFNITSAMPIQNMRVRYWVGIAASRLLKNHSSKPLPSQHHTSFGLKGPMTCHQEVWLAVTNQAL